MSSETDFVAALSKHELFAHLDAAALDNLAGKLRRTRVARGQVLFQKGDEGDSLIWVKSGRIKIGLTVEDGRESILNVIQPGELFGEIALLDGGPRTADATALETTELLLLPRVEFARFLAENPALALPMMAVLCERVRRTTALVEDAFFLDVPHRLARRLVWLAQRASRGGEATDGPIEVKISQEELAYAAGTSRESVNRELRAWQSSGWLSLGYGRVEIHDLAALEDFATQVI
jgi:CRP/FNR family cyclic AMP-dependent transcriptional regulator